MSQSSWSMQYLDCCENLKSHMINFVQIYRNRMLLVGTTTWDFYHPVINSTLQVGVVQSVL